MEIVEGSKIINESLVEVSVSSNPTDDSRKTLKSCSERKHGNDPVRVLGKEDEVLNGNMEGNGDGVATVVVKTTVVEETEVSVVKMIHEDEEEMGAVIEKNIEEDEETGGYGGGEKTGERFEYSVSDGKKFEEIGIQKTGNQGVFSNLFGDSSEDMEVKCSDNGVSLGVDVKGSLAGENGSEVQKVFAGDSASVANGHEGNTGGDPMEVEVCLSKEEENDPQIGEKAAQMDVKVDDDGEHNEKAKKIGESDSKMVIQENGGNLGNESAGIEVEENDHFDGEEDENEEDHDFVVGDFVWGKIKSHPWWPGQIYDPRDASEFAAKVRRKGQLLVAYFGDASFSWCSPSQLLPFSDHFQEMSEQSNSKSFVNAVQNALDEVSRLVEAELMCKCLKTDGWIESALATNGGIKEGVPVPKGNTIKVLIDRMEPLEILSTLDFSATMQSTAKTLELNVLRSFLTVFYRRKGGYSLPVYHEPKCIEGLEDKTRSGIVENLDHSGPSVNDKLHQGRKQKSVAELLGDGDAPKQKKGKVKDEAAGTKSSSGTKRERKRKALVSESPESDRESGGITKSSSGMKKERKRKVLVSESPETDQEGGGVTKSSSGTKKERKKKVLVSESPETDQESGGVTKSSSGMKKERKRKVLVSEPPETDQESGGVAKSSSGTKRERKRKVLVSETPESDQESGGVTPRQRKKSKYLSPPYTSSIRETKPHSQKVVEIAATNLEYSSPPVRRSSAKKSDERALLQEKSDSHDSKEHDKIIDAAVNVNKVLSELLCAALDPSYLKEKKYLTVITDFISSFRSSIFQEEKLVSEKRDETSDLAVIGQKLEMMSALVKSCEDGKMTMEMKASLEGGMKELLKKIRKMGKY